MVTIVIIIAFALLLLGILGSIIPGLPGPPISYLGVLLIHFLFQGKILTRRNEFQNDRNFIMRIQYPLY